ncbi:MAG: ArnT family glycosyltransferase [Gemmataceae bacterium]
MGNGTLSAQNAFGLLDFRRSTGWILLLAAAASLMFVKLADRDLWSSHEARAAMDAQSLLEKGSNGIPRLYDGQLELQKPPAFYWLVAGIAYLRGGEVDAFAVRFPSALSALAILITVFLVVSYGMGRPLAGVLSSLILATGIHFPWLARIGRIDMALALSVTVAGLAWILHEQGWSKARWLAYLACAMGFLLKGPIGLLAPLAILAALLIFEGKWPAIWEYQAWRNLATNLSLIRGMLLVAALVLPLFLWLEHQSDGQFFREFFWLHNVQRGLGGSRLRSHPLWLYAPFLLLYTLPWSVFLIAALTRPASWKNDFLARAGLAWLVGVLILLSASKFKRADYLLPAYPGAALFLGCWLEHQLLFARSRFWSAGIAMMTVLVLLGWTYRIGWSLPAEEPYRDYRPFARVVRSHAGSSSVVFFQAEAHTLAFRVGQPLVQTVEWTELSKQVKQAGSAWVVMRPEVAAEADRNLPEIEWTEVSRITAFSGGQHERPLVLLQGRSGEPHAKISQASPHFWRTAQRHLAGSGAR